MDFSFFLGFFCLIVFLLFVFFACASDRGCAIIPHTTHTVLLSHPESLWSHFLHCDSPMVGYHLSTSLTACELNAKVKLYHKNDSKVTIMYEHMYVTSSWCIIFLHIDVLGSQI